MLSGTFIGGDVKKLLDQQYMDKWLGVLLKVGEDYGAVLRDIHQQYTAIFAVLDRIKEAFVARFLDDDEVRRLSSNCEELYRMVASNFPAISITPKLHNMFGMSMSS